VNAPEYDAKTDAALNALPDFENEDFVRLALACLDQAGISLHDVKRVHRIVRETYPDLDEVQP